MPRQRGDVRACVACAIAGDTTASASARVNEIAVAFIAWAPRGSMGVRMAVTGHGRVWCRVRLHLAVGMAVFHRHDFRLAACRAVVINVHARRLRMRQGVVASLGWGRMILGLFVVIVPLHLHAPMLLALSVAST